MTMIISYAIMRRELYSEMNGEKQMRKSGVLMPVASLPAAYMCGDFGPAAYTFADMLKENGFTYWQVLPLNPVGFGNSPYQCYSSRALDEIYVSPELLYEEGMIAKLPRAKKTKTVDYTTAKALKRELLQEAFAGFKENAAFRKFAAQEWVRNYALFITFKEANGSCWNEWDDAYKNYPLDPQEELYAKHQDELRYHIFAQFVLHQQFTKLKNYLHKKGMKLFGDLPFYVGIDSDDVYFNRDCFTLDQDGRPTWIAGVPPDYFSETGQRWGNPLYDWDHLRETDYAFWFDRLYYSSQLYDLIRVDHFRAFDTYWKIDAKEETAVNGEWVINTGDDFFARLYEKYPDIQIAAEDLGLIRPEVYELRDKYGLAGMHVLQFAFFEEAREHEIAYTGTHDNDALVTWFRSLDKAEQTKIRKLVKKQFPEEKIYTGILAFALAMKSELVILSVTDILEDTRRINFPGTVGSPNWEYKIDRFDKLQECLAYLKQFNIRFKRAR